MARTREQIIELVRLMQLKTVANGCTIGEAEKFAAKAAAWIEEYQIEEAELRASRGEAPQEVEVCENILRTGKRVFNPGMTAVVNGLALGVCCRVIMFHRGGEAVYGIVGDRMDADYVCQIALRIIPSLRMMANMEGAEHGHEKAGLVRWSNQYLMGAGESIRRRLERERAERSRAKEAEAPRSSTALTIVTGESLAIIKRETVAKRFKEMYPNVKTTFSRSGYDGEARQRGREMGDRVGLHVGLTGNTPKLGG